MMATNLVPRNTKKTKDSNNILTTLLQTTFKMNDNKENDLIYIIEKASQEMQDAQNFFDNVTDPELIDHAIFRMEAAKSKYAFLLKKAKDNGARINF
ncbi:MAG: DUF2508 family protein [Bacillota bacterium]